MLDNFSPHRSPRPPRWGLGHANNVELTFVDSTQKYIEARSGNDVVDGDVGCPIDQIRCTFGADDELITAS